MAFGYRAALPPIGSTYRTGQKNPVSGVYRNTTCTYCTPGGREIPLSQGETFPPCRSCSRGVVWMLVRYA